MGVDVLSSGPPALLPLHLAVQHESQPQWLLDLRYYSHCGLSLPTVEELPEDLEKKLAEGGFGEGCLQVQPQGEGC